MALHLCVAPGQQPGIRQVAVRLRIGLILENRHGRRHALPGIPPTGRKVALPHVVVMKFKGDKIAHEHIYWDQACLYWDQACLLAQIGLLDSNKLPVTRAEQAKGLLEKSRRTKTSG